jgi:hypothetical protein
MTIGVQEVPGSNLGSSTKFLKDLQTTGFLKTAWSPNGVQNGRYNDMLPSLSAVGVESFADAGEKTSASFRSDFLGNSFLR